MIFQSCDQHSLKEITRILQSIFIQWGLVHFAYKQVSLAYEIIVFC